MEEISKTEVGEPVVESADTGENSVSAMAFNNTGLQCSIFLGKWTK